MLFPYSKLVTQLLTMWKHLINELLEEAHSIDDEVNLAYYKSFQERYGDKRKKVKPQSTSGESEYGSDHEVET